MTGLSQHSAMTPHSWEGLCSASSYRGMTSKLHSELLLHIFNQQSRHILYERKLGVLGVLDQLIQWLREFGYPVECDYPVAQEIWNLPLVINRRDRNYLQMFPKRGIHVRHSFKLSFLSWNH